MTNEIQEIDVEQVMQRIRENLRRGRDEEEAPTTRHDPAPFALGPVTADLASLHSGYDISSVPLVSHRRVLGSLIVATRRTIRKLLAPILERQVAYNAASTRVATYLRDWVEAVDRQQADALHALEEQVAKLERGQVHLVERWQAESRARGHAEEVARQQAQINDAALVERARLHEEIGALEARGREAMLAAEARFREALGEALAAQAPINEALLGRQARLGEELGVQSQALHTIKLLERARAAGSETLLTDHARLREEIGALEARGRGEMQAAEARWRGDMQAAEARFREALGEALAAQGAVNDALVARQAQLGEEFGAQSQALHALKQSSAAGRERIASAERKLRRVLHGSEPGPSPMDPSGSPGCEGPHGALAPRVREPGFDYAGFEERFRGSEEDIKERQRIYMPYFEGRDNVVDIGCGRGEFLELMREGGITARGVDLDLDMALLCREKGLNVSVADAYAYLEAVPDHSLGGVFAAQVIEHLPPPRVIELVTLCQRKIEPGGVLILETPNPKCLMVFADTFYKDPSHIQPAHPDTMQFLFEALDFHQVELKFLAPVDPSLRLPCLQAPGVDLQRFNEGVDRLNALLFGFQDYAVIGRKSLAPSHQERRSSRAES